MFDTLLARERRVQALARHLERLRSAVSELYGWAVPTNLEAEVRDTASALIEPHRLRIDAIPRSDGLVIEIAASRLAAPPPPDAAVALRPVRVPGGIGPYKWRDRRLIESLSDERTVPLILDAGDELLEAGSMNVWIVEARRIVTPPADGRLLAGVTRALLLEAAPALGLEAFTEPITLGRARAADAIFVTSSIRRAAPALLDDAVEPAPHADAVTAIRDALDVADWS